MLSLYFEYKKSYLFLPKIGNESIEVFLLRFNKVYINFQQIINESNLKQKVLENY